MSRFKLCDSLAFARCLPRSLEMEIASSGFNPISRFYFVSERFALRQRIVTDF